MNIPISAQMYTVREESAKDFIGTLSKLAEMGYKGVELAGYGNLSATKMKSVLKELKLEASGSHVGLNRLLNNLDEEIEYSMEIGNRYIICPWAKYDSKEDYYKTAAQLNIIGEKCKNNGIRLAYHNHAHEFEKFDGEYGLDILFRETDPEKVFAELDVYWVKYIGIDPVQYLRKLSSRCLLVHLKDMEADDKKFFAEVGTGIIDIRSIAEVSKLNGAEWFIVEQDQCRRPPLESVKISIDNLKKMGLA